MYAAVELAARHLGEVLGDKPLYVFGYSTDAPYVERLRELLATEGRIAVQEEWVRNARRFFYYSLYHASMDLSAFLDPVGLPKCCVKAFDARELMPERSEALRAIREGIVEGADFRMN